MIMRVLKDFVDSNELPLNANTRTSSIQTAIAAVIYTNSRKEALTLSRALSEFFAIIRDDDLGYAPVREATTHEFSQEIYVQTAMTIYDFLSCLMVLDDVELTKRLNISKNIYGGNNGR
jgi:hypothetical protein